MKLLPKIGSIGLAISLGFVAMGAMAGTNDNAQRVFVHSQNPALKALLGERWSFSDGFTTDMPAGQAHALAQVAKHFGVTVESVPEYTILKPPSGGTGGRVGLPTDRTPWGIETMYQNPSLTATSGGAGIKVAVLDTGVMRQHLDLTRRVVACKNFTRRGVQEGCTDGNGHGTHVAGTILADGAADNLGVYGMAPEAQLLAYKVCSDSGRCSSDDIAVAIRQAADQGAHIISMSLGSNSESSWERDAIAYAVSRGVLVVAAAGNDGPADGSIDYPGANPNVVAVGALDSALQVASWSSRGINDGDGIIEAREVEFAAPGVSVLSAWNDGGYRSISGTSMATPHIAGLAAKLWQGSAGATRTYLQSIATDVWTGGEDTATGFGLPHLP